MTSILITGATGAFGKAFVNQLLMDDFYERICIYSRSESKQAQMRDEFDDDQRLRWFIGDVRDKDRLKQAMWGVDHVVHAAALKRIEVGYYNPVEMVKTNVEGTINVCEAAAEMACEKVVTLSSDKAWQPVSAYGQSKALAESITLACNHVYGKRGPKYSATRYGNVADSTGSVIPIWRYKMQHGLTCTMTDPECTRFWMTQEEAVTLVKYTLFSMPTEVAIPDLPAYQLEDLYMAMKDYYDPEDESDLVITELPAWEKLHEGMCDGNTSDKARRLTREEITTLLSEIDNEEPA